MKNIKYLDEFINESKKKKKSHKKRTNNVRSYLGLGGYSNMGFIHDNCDGCGDGGDGGGGGGE